MKISDTSAQDVQLVRATGKKTLWLSLGALLALLLLAWFLTPVIQR